MATIYDSVPTRDPHPHNHEDHEESRSSTEVNESLIGDGDEEKQAWKQTTTTNCRRRQMSTRLVSSFQSYRSLIDTLLLLLIIFLLFILLMQRDTSSSSSMCGSSSSPSTQATPTGIQLGGDFTGTGPIFETDILKFGPDFSFVPSNATGMFSSETLARWQTLMPAGAGWGATDKTFFTTSMTHSLHCLFMMARTYAGVVDGMTDRLPKDYHDHFFHCIDYVRQGVMCSADVAMEGHLPQESADFGPLDGGWNAHHVCKDYDQVINYLDDQIKAGVRMVLPIDD